MTKIFPFSPSKARSKMKHAERQARDAEERAIWNELFAEEIAANRKRKAAEELQRKRAKSLPRQGKPQQDAHVIDFELECRIEAQIAHFTHANFLAAARRVQARKDRVLASDIFNALCRNFVPRVRWPRRSSGNVSYAQTRLIDAYAEKIDELWKTQKAEDTDRMATFVDQDRRGRAKFAADAFVQCVAASRKDFGRSGSSLLNGQIVVSIALTRPRKRSTDTKPLR